MKFEIQPDNTGKVHLSPGERQILNQAVIRRVLKAALRGGTQIDDGPLTRYLLNMLYPKTFMQLDLSIAQDQAAVFADVVEDYARDAQEGNVRHAIVLSNQFARAERLLIEHEERQYIDQQVTALVIPDNIEGLI